MGAATEATARFATQLYADKAQRKGDKRDNSGAQQKTEIVFQKSCAAERHGDPHRHRVNAGGNGGKQQRFPLQRVFLPVLLFAAEHFPQHFTADKSEQAKRDPVIHRHDLRGKQACQQVAENGHNPLEQAKCARDFATLQRGSTPEKNAVADGNGKRVGRETDRDEQQSEPIHTVPPNNTVLRFVFRLFDRYFQ